MPLIRIANPRFLCEFPYGFENMVPDFRVIITSSGIKGND